MQYHPLFTHNLSLDDPEQAERAKTDVGFMHIFRIVGGRPVIAGPQFTAEQIPNVEALHELLGGGDFEIAGRPPNNQGVCIRTRISLEGAPKYLGVKSTDPGAPPSPTIGGGITSTMQPLLELLTVMRTLNPPPPAPPDQSAVLAALITSMGEGNRNTMQMIAQQSAQSQQTMVELIKALQQPARASDGTVAQDSFMRGIQMFSSIAKEFKGEGGESKPFNWDTILEIADRVMQSVQAGHKMLETVNSAGAAETSPPAAAPAPGVAPELSAVHTAGQAAA